MSQRETTQFTYIDYGTNSIQVGDGKNPCISDIKGTLEIPSQVNSKNVTSIGNYAFSNCNISNVKLPDTIQFIGSFAFMNCKITEFICPISVIQIGTFAFYGCSCVFANFGETKIKRFTGEHHFFQSQLANVLLPDTLEVIAYHMFYKTNLKNITIPKSCKEISAGAFIECIYLEEFFTESPEFCINNKVLYSKNFKTLIAYPSNCFPDILPTVTCTSSARGFSGTSFVNFTLTIPLKVISSYAFRGCPNLEYVDLSCARVTSIFDAIFYDCNKLGTVILPQQLKSIDKNCFSYTNIIKLAIPPNVKSIHDAAFISSKITEIYYCGLNTFDSISLQNTNVIIHVSDYFPKTITKLLGCPIEDRTYTCQEYTCNNMIDQSFMDCPSMNICLYSNFYARILLYSVFIVM